MNFEILNSIISASIGALIAILTTYFNHMFQAKRDNIKYENERIALSEKLEFEEKKEYRYKLIQSIEEIVYLLGLFENSISMTSSVIQSENNMNVNDFDILYQKEIIQLQKLKSLIISKFPHFYKQIQNIEGYHSNFWGTQRNLLRLDYDKNEDAYRSTLNRISQIVRDTYSEIADLNYEFGKYVENNYLN